MNRRASPVPEGLHLPTEILATIINELASDTEDNDKTLAALAACRLASHTLCSLAIPLFFSSIQLTDSVVPPFASRMERLKGYKLLSNRAKNLNQILSSDDIADSVKTLTLNCHTKNFASPNDILISKILHQLPNIQTFSLETFATDWEGIGTLVFSDLAKDFRSAIQALCKSPNLTTLYLHGIVDFPITVIAACLNLRHLRLWDAGLDFDGADSTDETSRLQPPHLDSLVIDDDTLYSCSPDNYRSFANIFCSRLRNLQIKSLFYDLSVMTFGWDIILSASQTLTTLDLPMEDADVPLADLLEAGIPLDLSRLPALRHVKIQEQCSLKDNVTLLEFLNQLLSTSASSSGIETLEIYITYELVDVGSGKDLFLSDAGWSRALADTQQADTGRTLETLLQVASFIDSQNFVTLESR